MLYIIQNSAVTSEGRCYLLRIATNCFIKEYVIHYSKFCSDVRRKVLSTVDSNKLFYKGECYILFKPLQ